MKYITLKSEVWAHMDRVGEEYYRYEIITRMWMRDNEPGYCWQTTILRIDRTGDVTNVKASGIKDDWWIYFQNHIQKRLPIPLNDPAIESKQRQQAQEEHAYAVRLAMG